MAKNGNKKGQKNKQRANQAAASARNPKNLEIHVSPPEIDHLDQPKTPTHNDFFDEDDYNPEISMGAASPMVLQSPRVKMIGRSDLQQSTSVRPTLVEIKSGDNSDEPEPANHKPRERRPPRSTEPPPELPAVPDIAQPLPHKAKRDLDDMIDELDEFKDLRGSVSPEKTSPTKSEARSLRSPIKEKPLKGFNAGKIEDSVDKSLDQPSKPSKSSLDSSLEQSADVSHVKVPLHADLHDSSHPVSEFPAPETNPTTSATASESTKINDKLKTTLSSPLSEQTNDQPKASNESSQDQLKPKPVNSRIAQMIKQVESSQTQQVEPMNTSQNKQPSTPKPKPEPTSLSSDTSAKEPSSVATAKSVPKSNGSSSATTSKIPSTSTSTSRATPHPTIRQVSEDKVTGTNRPRRPSRGSQKIEDLQSEFVDVMQGLDAPELPKVPVVDPKPILSTPKCAPKDNGSKPSIVVATPKSTPNAESNPALQSPLKETTNLAAATTTAAITTSATTTKTVPKEPSKIASTNSINTVRAAAPKDVPLAMQSNPSSASASTSASSTSKHTQQPDLHNELIVGVAVVGFHHTRGPEVEYWVGPNGNQADLWPYLPFQSLPDGSHSFEENICYFTVLYDPSTGTAPNPTPERDSEGLIIEKSNFNKVETLFGISCTRQISSEILVSKTDDITRSTVQKSLVVMARKPVFGPIKEKLKVVTRTYFDQKDFGDRTIIDNLYENVRHAFKLPQNHSEGDFLVGTNPRELLHNFGAQVLVLFKALLLEKRIAFYASDTENLCTTQFSLISLIPDLLNNLQDCGSPLLSTYETKLVKPTFLRTSDRASLLKFLGLPLQVFAAGGMFNPFIPLQLIEELKQPEMQYGMFGSTNKVFFTQGIEYDILVDVDNSKITIENQSLRKALDLTSADKSFLNTILSSVNSTWDAENAEQPTSLGYNGSDDYIRHAFEDYLIALVSCAKYNQHLEKQHHNPSGFFARSYPVNPLKAFNSTWATQWQQTNNYRIFNKFTDEELFDIVEPCHIGLFKNRKRTDAISELRGVLNDHEPPQPQPESTLSNKFFGMFGWSSSTPAPVAADKPSTQPDLLPQTPPLTTPDSTPKSTPRSPRKRFFW